MATQMQYEFDWTGRVPHAPLPTIEQPETNRQLDNKEYEAQSPHASAIPDIRLLQPQPLPEAIGRAVFGSSDDEGVVVPSPEGIAENAERHGFQLVDLLEELGTLENRMASVATDKEPEAYDCEKDRLSAVNQRLVGMYAEDFGDAACREMERWAQHQVKGDDDGDACQPAHFAKCPPNSVAFPAEKNSSPAVAAQASATVASWDFQTRFPKPFYAAIKAGVIGYEDIGDAEIRAIHEEYANECLATLEFLDDIESAQVTGIDPRDGSQYRTEKTCQRLKKYLEWAPAALTEIFEGMMTMYTSTFGAAATQAFRSWIAMQHRSQKDSDG